MHTQAPWTFEPNNGDDCGMIVGKTRVVCDFVDDPIPEDATLIAAAPQLLLALKLLKTWDFGASVNSKSQEGSYDSACAMARAAIQKAEGV